MKGGQIYEKKWKIGDKEIWLGVVEAV